MQHLQKRHQQQQLYPPHHSHSRERAMVPQAAVLTSLKIWPSRLRPPLLVQRSKVDQACGCSPCSISPDLSHPSFGSVHEFMFAQQLPNLIDYMPCCAGPCVQPLGVSVAAPRKQIHWGKETSTLLRAMSICLCCTTGQELIVLQPLQKCSQSLWTLSVLQIKRQALQPSLVYIQCDSSSIPCC